MPDASSLRDKKVFEAFLEEEVRKVRGVSRPVRAGLLYRLTVSKASPRRIHPNPEDEFCDPRVGPNYSIISRYERDLGRYRQMGSAAWVKNPGAADPLQVQRISTGGFQLLNGHHRWAAALRIGMPRIRIQVLDITQERDIREMLRHSRHDRRVTLDLDEVIFRPYGDSGFEPQLPFLSRRIFRERLRLGIPALFQYLANHGWDVWVYTSAYYSTDYLRRLFRRYSCPVAGVITGTGRKVPGAEETKRTLEKMFEEKYQSTLYIDNETVLQTHARSGQFREEPIELSGESWASAVIRALQRFPKED